MSPVAPFFSEWLFQNLCGENESVHLSVITSVNKKLIDSELEERMQLAQDICSLVLSLRKKTNLKVRQPLQKIVIPVLNNSFRQKVDSITDLIKTEVNIKQIEYTELSNIKKKAKLNFKTVGQKQEGKFKEQFGKYFNEAAKLISVFDQNTLQKLLSENSMIIALPDGTKMPIETADLEITTEEMKGFEIASKADLTVALDITLSNELIEEGIARELISGIQKYRKENGFQVTDKIAVSIEKQAFIENSVNRFKNYICAEILADSLQLTENLASAELLEVNDKQVKVIIKQLK